MYGRSGSNDVDDSTTSGAGTNSTGGSATIRGRPRVPGLARAGKHVTGTTPEAIAAAQALASRPVSELLAEQEKEERRRGRGGEEGRSGDDERCTDATTYDSGQGLDDDNGKPRDSENDMTVSFVPQSRVPCCCFPLTLTCW